MALIVEDGSGVAGANSYISVTDARAYATARGLRLPTTSAEALAYAALIGLSTLTPDEAVEILLTMGLDFIEGFRSQFQGSKTAEANALQWPRTGACLDGFELDDDEIPAVLPQAQAQLACDAYGGGTPVSLMPSGTDGREVLREKVDVIEVQYSPGSGGSPQPTFTAARALLRPLLRGAGLFLQTVRV